MTRYLLAGLALSAALPGAALADATDPANWPDLFREAVTPRDGDVVYQYDSLINDNGFEEGETLHYQVLRRPDGNDSVEFYSVPDKVKRENIEKSITEEGGDIWCDDYRDSVGSNVELVSEDAASATYAFMVNPDSTEDKTERKIFNKTQMTVTIDKADKRVTGFSYKLLEPVKPMVVAKIREFSLIGQCKPLENGRPHVASVETRVSGSAMGNDFDQVQNQTVSNVAIVE